ncbi:hypothetical protein [Alicyclobacillus vulcanalis]|uniref:Stage III sporulation protein AG n=1 Tax=Alicyclobacillus vulcanalis TaxID=252246 RepID=A0A1N7KNK8_9BACL|nr:hypothetical protein [Alicyclobacillus vulcanalis]SIS63158.1 stage III sporulation protein AG [Alicyclobacillus vulcanalis]
MNWDLLRKQRGLVALGALGVVLLAFGWLWPGARSQPVSGSGIASANSSGAGWLWNATSTGSAPQGVASTASYYEGELQTMLEKLPGVNAVSVLVTLAQNGQLASGGSGGVGVIGVLVTVDADDFVQAKTEIVDAITNVLDVPAYKITVEPQKGE